MKFIKSILFLLIFNFGLNFSASACHAVTISQTSATDNLDGTFTYVFNVCMGIEDTWGFYLDFTGANVVSASPSTLTGTYSTIGLSIPPVSGNGDLEYGDFDNTGGTKFSEGTNSECFAVTVTFDGPITAAYVENDQENVASNCTGTTTTTSCFATNTDFEVEIETYGPCTGGLVRFQIDGSTINSMTQNGTTYSFGICGSCSTSINILAPAGIGKKPLCPGGVASYTLTNGDGSVVYSSGGGDNATSYLLGAPGCPLSVSIFSFEGEFFNDQGVFLKWIVDEQKENDVFVVERSKDNIFWEPISFINGEGTTNETMTYTYFDRNSFKGENYYRIKDVNENGKASVSKVILVENIEDNKELIKIVDLLGKEVTDDYNGVILEIYSNGTVIKKYRDNERISNGH